MQVRLGDLDEVAEDIVEANLQRLDAGALPLTALDLRDVPPTVAAKVAKLVETGKPAGRILSIVMGFVALLGFPLLTLLGVLILRLSLSPDVSRYCR